jgi:amidophosphoribosyltransferase
VSARVSPIRRAGARGRAAARSVTACCTGGNAARRRGPPSEHCGVIGVYGMPNAAELVYAGLHSLQHRGQEAAGIVASDGRRIQSKKGLGLLHEAISPAELSDLPGHLAVGHVRYSTTGSGRVQNIQPLVIEYSQGIVAVAHNGNLTNAQTLRASYESRGSIFQTSTDSEVFVHLMADPEVLREADPLRAALDRVRGAYSLLVLTAQELVAARDPFGFRPLCIGRVGEGWVVASETCALDLIGAALEGEVAPGEILTISEAGARASSPGEAGRRARCVFEYIYFARPDSVVFGEVVHNVRLRLGENLAGTCPVEADVVIAVPDSGTSAALGYSRRSAIPLDMGFVRNHYVGRTFITPGAEARVSDVKVKLNVIRDVVRGKRLVVVDDSIVRGTTSRSRIASLREAGAREIHLRISAPPITHPCFYGIDFQHAAELVASDRTVAGICDFVGADSLGYQDIEGLLGALPGRPADYCLACFTGEYPEPVEGEMDKYSMEARCRPRSARPAQGRTRS